MKDFFIQWAGTLIVIAVMICVLKLMWYLAIPLLIVWLGIYGLAWIKHKWERGKVPPSRSRPILAHDVIDVEFKEIK